MQTDIETNATAFPTNVRQMGSADDGLRIYMEDYVHTYLYQYARSSATGEKLAVLMGRTEVIDGQKTIFISGVVQAKFTEKLKGNGDDNKPKLEVYRRGDRKIFRRFGNCRMDAFSTVLWGVCSLKRDEAYHKKVFNGDSKVFLSLIRQTGWTGFMC